MSDLAAEMSSKFDFLKKGLRTGDSVDRQQREMQAVHDGELQQIQLTLKKVQKELGFKEEEVRHYKNMAR